MEGKLQKITAALMGGLVVLVCVLTGEFSGVEAQQETQQEDQQEIQDGISGMELLDTYQGEEAQGLEHQMQMELPEGVTQEQVTVESDALHRRVTITIPGIDEAYYFEHPLRGSSTHIDNLILASEKESGIIEISLDEVYEVESKVEDSWLYLDFTSPQDIYEKVIVVDAGHGGGQPGAIKQGIYEKDLNLGIVLELKALLDTHSEWKVYYTRTDDTDVSLDDRVQLANLSHANLFISVHNNSTKTGEMSEYHGTEVMFDEEKEEEGLGTKRLSQICLEETVAACGSEDRGLIKGHSIYIIRTSQVPVALIEVGFMTNQTELSQLNSEAYQQQAAQGIYNGILRAFEEGF